MKLIDVDNTKLYEIKDFGTLTHEEILTFYDQGILEGEIIKINRDIKANRNIFFININNSLFSFKKKYAKEISVEEYYG